MAKFHLASWLATRCQPELAYRTCNPVGEQVAQPANLLSNLCIKDET